MAASTRQIAEALQTRVMSEQDRLSLRVAFSAQMSIAFTAMLQASHGSQSTIPADVVEFLGRLTSEVPFAGLYFMLSRAASYMSFRGRDFTPPILEIGAGNGVTSNLLFDGLTMDIGSNPNQSLLNALKKRSRVHREFRIVDVQSIDLPPSSIATVIANNCMYHVVDCRTALREIYRILKPGGSFMFSFEDPRLDSGISPITTALFRAAGLDQVLDEFKAKRSADFGARVDPFGSMDDLVAFARSIDFDVQYLAPCMSNGLYDFAHFFADFDELVGAGASSYLKMNDFRGDAPAWQAMAVPAIAARVMANETRCATDKTAAMYFLVLAKPA